jgi:phosphotransferase system  glucose/maltose/N-acetylglucosamine-specific IIC component
MWRKGGERLDRWDSDALGYDRAAMQLRPPSLDHGLVSGLWAIGLGLFILLGAVAVGVQTATAFIVAGLAAAVIFVYVRRFGEDRPRPRA